MRRRHDVHIAIISRAKTWFIVSAVLVAISAGSLYFRGVNAGLEFRGGTAFQIDAGNTDASVSDVRNALADEGIEEATIQVIGDDGFLIQTEHLDPRPQQAAVGVLAETLAVDEDEVNVTTVGPKWGAQITEKAIRALIIFLLVVLVYLSIRLEFKMATAAMVAVAHDLAITTGIYSLSGFEVTPSTVIAVLTILGYSLYDTVVIFDRVHERTRSLSAAGRVTYSDAANGALNEVLLRSINTTVISLLPVGSLLFVGSMLLGAQTLRELALALFIGLAVGAYSSVFIATPFLALWKEREDRWQTLRTRLAARGGDVPAPIPGVPAAAPAAAPQQAATAVADPEPIPEAKAKPKPPPRRKKKKKRRR